MCIENVMLGSASEYGRYRRKGDEFGNIKSLIMESKITGTECNCHMILLTLFDWSKTINPYNGHPQNEQDTYLNGLW